MSKHYILISLNVIIHVIILFSILTFFYLLYARNIEITVTNNQIQSAVNNIFPRECNVYTMKDGTPPNQSNKNTNNNQTNNGLSNNGNSIINQPTMSKTLIKSVNPAQGITLNSNINLEINPASNAPLQETQTYDASIMVSPIVHMNPEYFNYYQSKFQQPDITYTAINKGASDTLIYSLSLLYLLAFVFIALIIYTKSITFRDFMTILIENLVAFLFIGIFEIVFFIMIVMKYIAVPPSTVYTAFINSFVGDVKV